MTPSVSILIPVFNAREWVGAAIDERAGAIGTGR